MLLFMPNMAETKTNKQFIYLFKIIMIKYENIFTIKDNDFTSKKCCYRQNNNIKTIIEYNGEYLTLSNFLNKINRKKERKKKNYILQFKFIYNKIKLYSCVFTCL